MAILPDIKVQRGQVAQGLGGPTFVNLPETVDPDHAFMLSSNNNYQTAGDDTGQDRTLDANELSCGVQLSSTTQYRVERYNSGLNYDARINWECVEYVGPAGGGNEFIVRGRYRVDTVTTQVEATTIVPGIVDIDRCVPFINGQFCDDAANSANAALHIAWLEPTAGGTLRTRRGGDGLNNGQVWVTVVEFTGSNWEIFHGYKEGGGSSVDLDDITLVTDADGVTGSAASVTDWATAFIFKTHKGNESDDGIVDVNPAIYPTPSSTTQVRYEFHSTHNDSDAAGAREEFFVHVARHPDLNVIRVHDTSTKVDGAQNVAIGATVDLDRTASLLYHHEAGTGTSYPVGWTNFKLLNTTTLELWRSRPANPNETRIQVIDMAGIESEHDPGAGGQVVRTDCRIVA